MEHNLDNMEAKITKRARQISKYTKDMDVNLIIIIWKSLIRSIIDYNTMITKIKDRTPRTGSKLCTLVH
jgi:hypothetical protein